MKVILKYYKYILYETNSEFNFSFDDVLKDILLKIIATF